MASWLMLIAGKVEPQPLGDLLRAPRPGPLPVLPPPLPAALPRNDRPADGSPARGGDHAGQPVLHICLQRRIGHQFRWLWAAGGPFGVPLRGRRPVVQATAARRGVAAQLPRDRRGRPPQSAGHLPYPWPCARHSATSSRSANDRYRPESGFDEGASAAGGMPPASRNHRVPTAGDTPARRAASSLAKPAAIAAQNRRRSSRPATPGRPGERKLSRPARSERRFRVPIATPSYRCCDDHLILPWLPWSLWWTRPPPR